MGLQRRFYLLVNPAAGLRQADGAAGAIEAEAQAQGLEPIRRDLTAAGDGERAARELRGTESDLVVVGGDGTFNEVLNGADLARHRLAFFPAGTVNVLAKEFGIPSRPGRWLRGMRAGRERRFDVALAGTRRWFLVLGAGLDGRVIHEVSRARKLRFRFSDYFLPVARAALDAPRRAVRLEGGGAADGIYQFVVVGNCTSYGGPCRFTSRADPADGWLDVCAMRLGDVNAIFRTGLAALLGRAHACGTVEYFRTRHLRLSGGGEFYQYDGEAGGGLPVEVRVADERLRLLLPGRD
jgi:diacylglycerol kinase family enzyme